MKFGNLILHQSSSHHISAVSLPCQVHKYEMAKAVKALCWPGEFRILWKALDKEPRRVVLVRRAVLEVSRSLQDDGLNSLSLYIYIHVCLL